MSATASLGLSLLWDTDIGLSHIDKYTYASEEYIKVPFIALQRRSSTDSIPGWHPSCHRYSQHRYPISRRPRPRSPQRIRREPIRPTQDERRHRSWSCLRRIAPRRTRPSPPSPHRHLE